MSDAIHPCLWLDGRAREAAYFYASVFPGAQILGKAPPMIAIDVGGMKMSLLDGGPGIEADPSISFLYRCDSEAEIASIWKALTAEGKVRIELGASASGPRRGWAEDKFGTNWRLALGASPQKVRPALAFAGEARGRAEGAMRFYASIFNDSRIGGVSRSKPGRAPGAKGPAISGELYAGGTWLSLADSPQLEGSGFGRGISLVVICDTQGEIDYLWNKLGKGGSVGCSGWLADRYGVSWQILPRILEALLSDHARAPR